MNEQEQKNEKEEQDEHINNLLDMISQIEKNEKEQSGKKKNVLVIDMGPLIFKNIFLNFLIYLVINMMLGIVIILNIDVATFNKVYNVLIFLGLFTVVDFIIKVILAKRFLEIVVASLGSIFFLLGLISLAFISQYYPGFNFNNNSTLLLFGITFYLSRYAIITPLKRMIKIRKLNKFFGGIK